MEYKELQYQSEINKIKVELATMKEQSREAEKHHELMMTESKSQFAKEMARQKQDYESNLTNLRNNNKALQEELHNEKN